MGRCGIGEEEAVPVLMELVNDRLVTEGEMLSRKPKPQYFWRSRWETEAQRHAAGSRQKLQEIVSRTEKKREKLELEDDSVLAFYDYVINGYRPPKNKRFLVFLQCSVRRPFSSSPSHASMKRAISVATGFDPSRDFESCPVHVVVLASKIGPVPYELENVHPANVGGGGVKHFDWAYYTRVKPILAERMATYIITHRRCYDRITTFTESRYGEVMEEARRMAAVDFRILPEPDGPQIIRVGKSYPRKYWEIYWIQLCLEIVSWLNSAERKRALARLDEMGIKYSRGNTRDP
jgi:predicted RNA-binding protein